jgi:predicted dehydrogenase
MSFRAGIIGSTGRGDYGHSLDTAYEGISEVDVVAVADTDPEALAKAAHRAGAQRTYSDYREMVEKEDLDLVNVCPRRPGERVEMVVACAESGVKGIFCEKPFARTLADADDMLDACDRNGVRIVVAHQKRTSVADKRVKALIEQGAIGDVQMIRSRGKGDHRAGAEDLIVLGPHMMDSMRWFAGADAAWAFGHVTQDGRDVVADDAYDGAEEIGLIAGNAIGAHFAFTNGVVGQFESRRGFTDNNDDYSRWFGLEIHGTKGILATRNAPRGELYLYPNGIWIPDESYGKWERIYFPEWEYAPDGTLNKHMAMCNDLIAKQLIEAIAEDKEVTGVATGTDGRAAIEMIAAIFESHRLKSRVDLPLKNRENPFVTWQAETTG